MSPFFREVVVLHEPSKTLLVADSVWRVRKKPDNPYHVCTMCTGRCVCHIPLTVKKVMGIL